MVRGKLLIISLAVPLIFTVISRAAFSEEPISNSEMQKLFETIKSKYSNHIYSVNAWSRITTDSEGKKITDNTIRRRRKIGTAFALRECGYLVTPLCVISNAERISVVPQTGDEVDSGHLRRIDL